MSRRSRSRCAAASRPTAALRISPLTFATAFATPFAEIALLVAVAQLVRFARARRGARRHGRPAARAAREHHLGFDGGVAPRVDDFEAYYVLDRTHCRSCNTNARA